MNTTSGPGKSDPSREGTRFALSSWATHGAVLLFVLALVLRLLSRRDHPFYMEWLGFPFFVSTLILTSLGFYLCGRLSGDGLRGPISPPLVLVLLFSGWVAVSTPFASYTFASTTALGVWAGHLAAFLLVVLLAENDPHLLVFPFAAACASTFWQLLYGGYQYLWLFPALEKRIQSSPSVLEGIVSSSMRSEFRSRVLGGEPSGTLLNPNSFVALVVLGGALLIGAALLRWWNTDPENRTWWTMAGGTGGLVGVAWITVLAGSQGGQIAAVGAGVVTGYVALKPWIGRHWWWGAGGIGCAGLAGLILIPAVDWQAYNRPSLTFRSWYTTAGLKMARDHPVTGVGLYNYQFHYPDLKPPCAEETRRAHSDYIDVTAETGVPGGLLFLAFWILLPVSLLPGGPGSGEEGPSTASRADAGGGGPPSTLLLMSMATVAGLGFLVLFGLNAGPTYRAGHGFLFHAAAFLPWLLLFRTGVHVFRPLFVNPTRMKGARYVLLLPLLFYAIHALVDFDLYVPAVATVVWMVAGAGCWIGARTGSRSSVLAWSPGRNSGMGVSLVGLLLLVPVLLEANQLLRSAIRLEQLTARSASAPRERMQAYREAIADRPEDIALLLKASSFYHSQFCERWARPSARRDNPGSRRDAAIRHFTTCISFLRKAKNITDENWAVHARTFRQIDRHRALLKKRFRTIPAELVERAEGAISREARFRALKRALEEYPTRARLLYEYGRTLDRRGNPSEAAPYFRRALRVDQCQNLERMRLTDPQRTEVRDWLKKHP